MSTTAMQSVFDEILGKFDSAEQMRNFESGGLYRENNKAAKQTVKALKDSFATAAAANDNAKMQSVFDETLQHFEGSDHIRNFLISRMYIEDEKITKQTVRAFKKRFADAIVAS